MMIINYLGDVLMNRTIRNDTIDSVSCLMMQVDAVELGSKTRQKF